MDSDRKGCARFLLTSETSVGSWKKLERLSLSLINIYFGSSILGCSICVQAVPDESKNIFFRRTESIGRGLTRSLNIKFVTDSSCRLPLFGAIALRLRQRSLSSRGERRVRAVS